MLDDHRSADRLEAMLRRVVGPPMEVVDDARFGEQLEAFGRRDVLERGGLVRRSREKDLVAFGHSSGGDIFPGYAYDERRNGRRELVQNGVLCHSAVEVQTVVGCPFDCTYCAYGAFVSVRMDVENLVERITATALSRRSQRLWKLNNRSDTLGLEPEYGLAAPLVERFAELEGKVLMLYSKGDSVEHLVDLDHREKTVASFTLTPELVASLLEVGAPPPSERIAAIRRLGAAGYPIRVRFSPIVPLRGWREAYASLVERLFDAATPEMITLWTLSMIDFSELERIAPLDAFDDELLAAARDSAETMRGHKGAPLPPHARAAIYSAIGAMIRAASGETHVALCLETEDVWRRAAATLTPRDGRSFLCNCGPHVTPGALVRSRASRD